MKGAVLIIQWFLPSRPWPWLKSDPETSNRSPIGEWLRENTMPVESDPSFSLVDDGEGVLL